ncbi:type 1 glutamine amidotransferase domain-containing protein [Tropicimonas isoalkanivorans]|uniref:Protease I n=1 Tax=Tropicimonas isoalkanivorans TaxID=441112 RepID=A0A1I1PTE9_9RHOB|nr:type 1 glutamine amidotransferase domain-containing protein [Tropicimonas isoalkanivorans]SFD10253.1 protease I [Tropicimonas isoalkanivorans]
MPAIENAKILIMASNGFEQSELEVPRDQLRARGATVHVATPDGDTIKGWDEKDWGRDADADLSIKDARCEDYDALVLPGGQINPDTLRATDEAVQLVKDFHDSGKTLAAICHAPWLLIEAGVISGRDATSFASIKTDMKNAGANWKDEEVVTDCGIVTSRSPDDLDAFVAKIVEEVEEGQHDRSAQ